MKFSFELRHLSLQIYFPIKVNSLLCDLTAFILSYLKSICFKSKIDYSKIDKIMIKKNVPVSWQLYFTWFLSFFLLLSIFLSLIQKICFKLLSSFSISFSFLLWWGHSWEESKMSWSNKVEGHERFSKRYNTL